MKFIFIFHSQHMYDVCLHHFVEFIPLTLSHAN